MQDFFALSRAPWGLVPCFLSASFCRAEHLGAWPRVMQSLFVLIQAPYQCRSQAPCWPSQSKEGLKSTEPGPMVACSQKRTLTVHPAQIMAERLSMSSGQGLMVLQGPMEFALQQRRPVRSGARHRVACIQGRVAKIRKNCPSKSGRLSPAGLQ